MRATFDDVLADLATEFDRLDAILSGLSDSDWQVQSGAPEWTVHQVLIHLALSEEAVASTLSKPAERWTSRDNSLDEVMDAEVRHTQETPSETLARWRAACLASLVALRSADPKALVRWAAAPLKPQTLATTRLAEHWAHALDVTLPLDIDLPDTDRLRHIAWLGHSTLPYAMKLEGLEPQPIFCALTSPSGDTWTYGPPDAASRIEGSVGAFCRVGARRVVGSESGLLATGPHAADALRVLRNYAA